MLAIDSINEQDVWSWCSDAYLRNGIRIRLPQCSDHTKTYQWRYIKSLTKKFNEWEFNRDTAIKFIEIAVQYAKELKVLNKGLSVFHQTNMLKVCYERLKNSSGTGDNLMVRLENSFNNFKTMENKKVDFLKRTDKMSFRNITNYYMSQRVCAEYLALSRSAIGALTTLAKLDPEERQLLPSDAALYLLRIRILDEYGDTEIVRNIIREV